MANRTNKYAVTALSVCAIAAAAIYFFANKQQTLLGLYKETPVIANINGQPVYQAEADSVVASIIKANSGIVLTYDNLDDSAKELIIREVAARRAILKQAKKDGFDQDKQIALQAKEYKNSLIRSRFSKQVTDDRLTDEIVRAKYDEIVSSMKGKKYYKAHHILVSTAKEAKNVKKKLKRKSFAKVAREFSIDDSTKQQGGALGYRLEGTLDADFEKALSSMKVGSISSPVKTKFGWHIIKLEDKKNADVAPFSQLQPVIRQELAAKIVKDYADSLVGELAIDILPQQSDEASEKAKAKSLSKNKSAAGSSSSDINASSATAEKTSDSKESAAE